MPMATSATSRSGTQPRLAEALLPLLGKDEPKALAAAEESLGSFATIFHAAYLGGLDQKLGLPANRAIA